MTHMAKAFQMALLSGLFVSGCVTTDSASPQPPGNPASVQESKSPPRDSKTASQETPRTGHPPLMPKPTPPTAHPSTGKPETLVGSTGKELINRFGQPNMILDVTMKGRSASEGYLYYPKDGKGCIHTFVVLEENNSVIHYFCQ
ncbi:MAG: hypothetical protein HQL99_08265 [Magnetococcales bacterium]|nr:hypothetical protein [Magnetococcales bacterium]